MYKRKKVPQEGSLKFEEHSDVDLAYAVPKRHHMLAFAGGKWFPFADPVQQTGWIIDIRISSPHVIIGNQHRVWKIVNNGTRLCSYIPKTTNNIIAKTYAIRTNNYRQGILKMVLQILSSGIHWFRVTNINNTPRDISRRQA